MWTHFDGTIKFSQQIRAVLWKWATRTTMLACEATWATSILIWSLSLKASFLSCPHQYYRVDKCVCLEGLMGYGAKLEKMLLVGEMSRQETHEGTVKNVGSISSISKSTCTVSILTVPVPAAQTENWHCWGDAYRHSIFSFSTFFMQSQQCTPSAV